MVVGRPIGHGLDPERVRAQSMPNRPLVGHPPSAWWRQFLPRRRSRARRVRSYWAFGRGRRLTPMGDVLDVLRTSAFIGPPRSGSPKCTPGSPPPESPRRSFLLHSRQGRVQGGGQSPPVRLGSERSMTLRLLSAVQREREARPPPSKPPCMAEPSSAACGSRTSAAARMGGKSGRPGGDWPPTSGPDPVASRKTRRDSAPPDAPDESAAPPQL